MNLAVLSDIHGNARALDTVLADIARRGIDRIVNLGDTLYGPFDPRPVADRLLAADWPTVAGNEDRCLVETAEGRSETPTARFTAEQLNPRHIKWLDRLPRMLEVGGFGIAFHGTPADDTRYLLTIPLENSSVRAASDSEIAERTGAVNRRLILCAHDHLPRVVSLPDGRTIVNPGSVGCPAFADDAPIPHAVENGSPHARYAVVAHDEDEYHAELITVAYDWNAAADEALRNGFDDWACWLRTGRAERIS